jgi:hypothetical protein
MSAYNLAAWLYRREPHLRTNALLYAAFVGWEVSQTRHHWERLGARAAAADYRRLTLPN